MDVKLTVSEAVWLWRGRPASLKDSPGARKKRALIQFCVMYIVASIIVLVFKRYWLGSALYGLSFLVLVAGFLVPPMFNLFERMGKWLARIVGAAMTYLLLVPFFYLCFLPGRLLLKAFGKDPMRLRWNPESKSYWAVKRKRDDPGRYARQY